MVNPISLVDALDAVRMLAGAYDEQLLRSDHVTDDLYDRGLLAVHRDVTDEYFTRLTPDGRQFVVALLMADQDHRDGEEDPHARGRWYPVADSFRGLVGVARRILDEHYPEDVFGPDAPFGQDVGAEFTSKLREALAVLPDEEEAR